MKFENETSDFNDIINRLNNFFSKIGSTSASADCSNENFEKLSDFIQSKVPSHVELIIPFIKLDQTESLLNKLDTSKATGLDDLGPYFLKLSTQYIAPSITYLINLSILEGIFPSNLKIAKISPLFKSGDKSLPGNNRPISVLPIL